MANRFQTRQLVILFCGVCGAIQGQQPAAPPSPADALFQSAVTQFSQRKFSEAEESFRKLAELEPATSRGIMGLAEVWAAQKKDGEALQLLQVEAGRFPARLELHFGIGNLASRMGNYDLAIAEFQFVLGSIDRNSKQAADLYFRIAEAYRLKGDFDFAIAILRQAQTVDSSNPAILNNLAFLLADSGNDAPLALAYALRARQLVPQEPAITDTVGWVYMKMNRADAAIPLFREATQKDPASAAYHYHLAIALEMHGEHAEARKESQAALSSNPSLQQKQKIDDLLREIK
jgi:tetratricopeptide (TPR) repeat protein